MKAQSVVSLKFGYSKLVLPMPGHARKLSFQEPEVVVSKQDFIHKLCKLVGKRAVKGQVAIVVADKTRLCGYNRILPWVLEALSHADISADRVTFYIAYGTHSRQSEDECLAAYGEVYNRCCFIHHDCEDSNAFVDLGKTSQGTEIKVRRDVVESELILTIGAVSHHYFAGYGGGRKLLFPGLAERKTIFRNHGLFLDQGESCLSKGCWPGNLAGNPLADDLKEIHHFLPEYLSIHAILDSAGKPAGYYFGKTYDDFLSVCSVLDSHYKVELEEQFDLVVASAGGFPKDINMIQAHKSIHNAANLVRDGGTLVMYAECRDGIGSDTFLPYFGRDRWMNVFSDLAANYEGNGGTALAMMEKTARINVWMVTDLPGDICRQVNVKKVTAGEVERSLLAHKGSIGVIANSSLLITDRFVNT